MHYSVLKEEVIDNLNIDEHGIYVDGTIGYAGHSSKILEKLTDGFLYGFDQDDIALENSAKTLSFINDRYKLISSNFVNMKEELQNLDVFLVDGILLDLGFSSPQIDDETRGFSFMHDGPLDMRMSSKGKSAKDVIMNYSLEDLTKIFYRYGEEKHSGSIAKKVHAEAENIHTTFDLCDIIKASVGANYYYKEHPERKIFQALRIEVNEELTVLEKVLPAAIEMLKPKGRLCVITFHSLEDRIVKNIFREASEIDGIVKGLPVIPDEYKPLIKLINKSPIIPTEKELSENSRSRSAKLRVIERI